VNERWLAHADEVLRGAGLKTSPGRTAVVELLAREGCLVGAQEVAERLRGTASQATVYRALDTLHAFGLVRRVDAGDGTGRFELADPSGAHHHHVVFEDGTVEPFADAQLEAAFAGLAGRLGVELTGHEVILRARRSG
jgi:Fur family transcriptional regulator, ferric uptake regulator